MKNLLLAKAGEISKREKIIQSIKDFAKDIMKKQENDLEHKGEDMFL